MNIGNLRVGIEVDKSGLTKGIQEVGKETTNLSKQLSTAFGAIAGLFSGAMIIGAIKNVTNAYINQEQAIIKLNFALKTQNIYSSQLSQSFQNQATALMKLTGFADEAITAGQAYAMNIGMQADSVKQLTPLVLDLAARLGGGPGSVEQAFYLVAKAAEGETGMLKRHGIIINENELKTKGFTAVIEKLQKSVGGMAAELGSKDISIIKKFGNEIGEMSERLGKDLFPTVKDIFANARQGLPFIEKSLVGVIAELEIMYQGALNVLGSMDNLIHLRFKSLIPDAAIYGERIAKIWEEMTKRMMEIDKAAADNRVAGQQGASNKITGIISAETEQIKALNKSVEVALVDGLANIMAMEKSFGENIADIWDALKHIILKSIAEQLVAEKASALGRIALEKAVSLAKNISAYVGIPFIGWVAIAAGAAVISKAFDEIASFETGIQNVTKKTLAILHPGEAVLTKDRNPYMGKSMEPATAGITNNLTFNNPVFLDKVGMEKFTRDYIVPALDRYKRKTYTSPFV